MRNPEKFSVRKRLKSFDYAFRGLKFFFLSQHNAWVHSLSVVLVIALGVGLKISTAEWIWVIFAIGLVFVAEIFNTALEELVDLVSPTYHARAGLAKDLAAAAVLFAAIVAATIAAIIFFPKIYALFF